MKKKTITAECVVLIPATEDDLGISLSVDETGQLRAALTITTDVLGDFLIPLTAPQLGMLSVITKQFLNLTEDQAAAIRTQLQAEQRKEPTDD